jgi:hypothetical protein
MNMYNPYIQQMPQTQDLGGLNPVYQNIGAQQMMQNAAMQQAQGLTQQAGQIGQQSGGMNPMMMAQMLRKKDQKPALVTDYSQPMPQYLDPAYMQAGY